MSPLPQDEPSDDFKAGWDKALAVASSLIKPPPLTETGDPVLDTIGRLSHGTRTNDSNAVANLKGAYQFRHMAGFT